MVLGHGEDLGGLVELEPALRVERLVGSVGEAEVDVGDVVVELAVSRAQLELGLGRPCRALMLRAVRRRTGEPATIVGEDADAP